MRNVPPGKYAVGLYEALREAPQERHAEIVSAFLKIVVRNGDASKLRRIVSAFKAYADEQEKLVEVRVASAEALDPGLQDLVRTVLSRHLDRQVVLREETDPGLVAGIVVRVGDTVIDGSLRRHLDRLSQALRR